MTGSSAALPRLVRVIARRVWWPSLLVRPNRTGLRLWWDAFAENGALLVAATEYPLADAAHVLLALRGLPGDTPITLRHDGATHDSFMPMPLRLPAAQGAKRAEKKARTAARFMVGRKNSAKPATERETGVAKQSSPALPKHRGAAA